MGLLTKLSSTARWLKGLRAKGCPSCAPNTSGGQSLPLTTMVQRSGGLYVASSEVLHCQSQRPLTGQSRAAIQSYKCYFTISSDRPWK